jgi:hypothetical protein
MIDERNDKEMRIELYISRREYMLIKKIAADEGLTLLDYATNVLRGWINNQLKGEYRKMFNKMNILECANLFGDVKKDGKINFETSSVEREKKMIRDKYKGKIKES